MNSVVIIQQHFKLSNESSNESKIVCGLMDEANRLRERENALYSEIETLRGEAGKS